MILGVGLVVGICEKVALFKVFKEREREGQRRESGVELDLQAKVNS